MGFFATGSVLCLYAVPRFSLVTALGKDENVWYSYQSLRSQLVSVEDELAEKYISPELYRRFRQHVLMQTMSAEELSIIEPLKQIEVDLLAGKRLNYELLISLVERIRQNTTDFAEWQTSSTAQYFQPQRFQNEKNLEVIGGDIIVFLYVKS